MSAETKMDESVASALNRRHFIKGTSFASLMTLMGGVEIAMPQEQKPEPASGTGVALGIIGLGLWGREILSNFARIPAAQVAGICDTYAPMLNRSKNAFPKAAAYADYKQLLANKEIKGVIIATPTHQHKEIAIAALEAGKHVYCEAPLAHTIDDAKAIALAAKAHPTQLFQAGLSLRSDPQRHFLLQFIRSGALGTPAMGKSQWHKKQSWRSTSPDAKRDQEINWRLNRSISTGLIGEIGIHHIDMASWFLNMKPTAVTGFGNLVFWKNDGREVSDSVQAVFEFPQGVVASNECSLVNSFDGDHETFYGSDAAVMIRGSKAWIFKEVDAPLLGWEVYARKDTFFNETGVALVANATKLTAQGGDPAESLATQSPLFYGLDAFSNNVNDVCAAVEDFVSAYGSGNKKALEEHFAKVKKMPFAGYHDGFDATVMAIKANESVVSGQKIKFEKEWFDLG